VETHLTASSVHSIRGQIEIRGLGKTSRRGRVNRVGRNQKTGARVEVPAQKIPDLKQSQELKDGDHSQAMQSAGRQLSATPAEGQSSLTFF